MTSQIKQFDPDRINKICRDLQRDLDRALGEVEIYVGIAKDLTARINSKRQRLDDLRRRIESTVGDL
ncbi:MAG: hypothetical protein IIB62_06710 [Proteobacteria bacterium]|nr:hypothetical protein [Pseudomonadota bacterium]